MVDKRKVGRNRRTWQPRRTAVGEADSSGSSRPQGGQARGSGAVAVAQPLYYLAPEDRAERARIRRREQQRREARRAPVASGDPWAAARADAARARHRAIALLRHARTGALVPSSEKKKRRLNDRL